MKKAKISVIVPVYNTESLVRKCLDSILNQTYENVELIVVSDGSSGNIKEIVSEYQKEYKNVIFIEHEKNKGLFQARVTGSKKATGDYIAFVDSDDHISLDYYRLLINKAEEKKSDIVLSETVNDVEEGVKFVFNHANNFPFEYLKGENCFESFIEQDGNNYLWHTVWNKIYTKALWDKVSHYYDKLTEHTIMCEDIAFSMPLYFYAKRIDKVKHAYYYYFQNAGASTSLEGLQYKKAHKNTTDIVRVFQFLDDFMASEKVTKKYEKRLQMWRSNLAKGWFQNVENSDLKTDEKTALFQAIEEIGNPKTANNDSWEGFYKLTCLWNEDYENLKNTIISNQTKYVSFDIFDTLVVRPFYEPSDLFYLMNPLFEKEIDNKSLLNFRDIRVESERNVRHENMTKQEISLDEIYEYIAKHYDVKKTSINKLKKLETELEIRFCNRRESAYELYELAKSLGKDIYIISDMYLPQTIIEKILEKNGYTDYKKLYVSCELNQTKWHKDLFKTAIAENKLNPSNMIHIGDNFESDKEKSTECGILGVHFPKAIDTLKGYNCSTSTGYLGKIFDFSLPEWRDNRSVLEYVGIRTMLGLIANKFFDNPFESFQWDSDFNANPDLIGYYALGMHMFGLGNWIAKTAKDYDYKNISFLARDGYLPKKIFDLFNEYYNFGIKSHYLPFSRKSILPISIMEKRDLNHINKFIIIENHTPNKVLKYLAEITKDVNIEKILKANGIDSEKKFKNDFEFIKFIEVYKNELFDEKKSKILIDGFKSEYESVLADKGSIFDVGYSCKPEAAISKVIGKPVDTFFIYTNSDEGYKYANKGKLKLHSFYQFRPTYGGGLRETVISEYGPSCIKYKIENKKWKVVYEEFEENYYEKYVLSKMQNSALNFCKDMLSLFNPEELDLLIYTDEYISYPFELFMQSAMDFDKSLFKPFKFEDTIANDTTDNIVDGLWNRELYNRNQKNVRDLLFGGYYPNNKIDVSNRNIFVKGIYYLIFDRVPLKVNVVTKTKKVPIIYYPLKAVFRALRWIRNTFYKIVYKIRPKKNK